MFIAPFFDLHDKKNMKMIIKLCLFQIRLGTQGTSRMKICYVIFTSNMIIDYNNSTKNAMLSHSIHWRKRSWQFVTSDKVPEISLIIDWDKQLTKLLRLSFHGLDEASKVSSAQKCIDWCPKSWTIIEPTKFRLVPRLGAKLRRIFPRGRCTRCLAHMLSANRVRITLEGYTLLFGKRFKLGIAH